MLKLDHVGIAVHNLNKSVIKYCKIFNVNPKEVDQWEAEEHGNKTAFLPVGDEAFEIMSPLEGEKGEGDIRKFLKKNGEGLYHLAFFTDDFDKTIKRLRKQRIPVEILEPEGDYKHAIIQPCEFTNQVRFYFFNKKYEH